jgi:hypothetical protein
MFRPPSSSSCPVQNPHLLRASTSCQTGVASRWGRPSLHPLRARRLHRITISLPILVVTGSKIVFRWSLGFHWAAILYALIGRLMDKPEALALPRNLKNQVGNTRPTEITSVQGLAVPGPQTYRNIPRGVLSRSLVIGTLLNLKFTVCAYLS